MVANYVSTSKKMLRKEIYLQLIINAIKMVLGVLGVIAVEERKHSYDSFETKKQGELTNIYLTSLQMELIIITLFIPNQRKITLFSTRQSQLLGA